MNDLDTGIDARLKSVSGLQPDKKGGVMRHLDTAIIAAVFVLLLRVPPASALVLGQADTFEDGTTQNWVVGTGFGVVHPAPPTNVADDGPLGAGDNFLLLTAVGGGGSGSRLTTLNLGQWAGDYTATGITAIAMDLKNLGASDLSIRLYLENPMAAPPTDEAVTSSVILLPAGGGWTHAQFMIDPLVLTVLAGDVNTLLSNVTVLRILHNPLADFPGASVTALLGVDNITALPAGPGSIPEPSAFSLLALGLAGLSACRKESGAPDT
jgi:hypothetical protein